MQAAKIQGLNAAIKNIRKISPDLLKEMNREIKVLTKEMVQDAKGYAPRTVPAGLSNWGNTGGQWSAFNSSEIIRGIRISTARNKIGNNGWSSQVKLLNASAAGAIYETAGRKNPTGQPWVGPNGGGGKRYSKSRNPNAGKQFIEAIERDSGITVRGEKQGRIIQKAFDDNKAEIVPAVTSAIFRASEKFNALPKKVRNG
jgi:hypothetical protein